MDNFENIRRLARRLVEVCTERGVKITTAESCTGGMVSAAITGVAGSSAVIELGVASYSNKIKRELLGVAENTLKVFSEYSPECVEEMAKGAIKLSGADYAVAISGVAGPAGGTEENPVGTVYICACGEGRDKCEKFKFPDTGRNNIRLTATEKALSMLLEIII